MLKVKDVLNKHQRWTKYAVARNVYGMNTDVRESDACRWCLVGAIELCYGPDYNIVGEVHNKLIKIISKMGFTGLAEFNDKSTFKDIQKVVKKANI